MAKGQRLYLSFMLRLWRAGNDGKPVWRASLQDPRTGERLGFANLSELFTYLEDQIKEADFSSEASPDQANLRS